MLNISHERRLTLFIPAACGLTFFIGLEAGGFQFILLKVALVFSLNELMMGIMAASQAASITLAALIFGQLADKIGKKSTLLIFMPIFSAGCFLTAAASSAYFFMGGVFLIGIGLSICESIGSSALSDSFPGRESRFLNIMQCSFSLGAVASPLLFKQLVMGWGFSWRLVFLVPGCGYAFLYPLMLLSECGNPISPKEFTSLKPDQNSQTGSILTILRTPFFLALLFSMMIYVSMEAGIAFFIDTFMTLEYSPILGAYGISLFWFAMAVSRFFFAWVRMSKHAMVSLGFAGGAIFLLLFLFIKNQWLVLCIYTALGFLMGPVWPMIMGIGMSAYQEKSGMVGGILYASGGAGGMISPILIGFVAGHSGGKLLLSGGLSPGSGFYRGFILLSLFSFSALLVMQIWGKTRKERE